MGKVFALKGSEGFESRKMERALKLEPALVIHFGKKRAERLQKKAIQKWALDGLYVLRIMISDYEVLMNHLAQNISPEQLVEITALSADDQIQEDLRRLYALLDGMETLVKSKSGMSLREAFRRLKVQGSEEMSLVIEYLEASDYPVFQAMMKLIDYTSEGGGDYGLEKEMESVSSVLGEMGALDSVNGIEYLLENLLCEAI